MNKQNFVSQNMVHYFHRLTRKELLTHVTTWMNLENTILTEINQSKWINTVLFHLLDTVLFHLLEIPRGAKFRNRK